MTKQFNNEWISAYFDGEVSQEEAEQFKEEVARRPELAKTLEEMQSLRSALKSMPRKQAPANFQDRILAAIDDSAEVAASSSNLHLDSNEPIEDSTRSSEVPSVALSLPRSLESSSDASIRSWRWAASAIISVAALILISMFISPRHTSEPDPETAMSEYPISSKDDVSRDSGIEDYETVGELESRISKSNINEKLVASPSSEDQFGAPADSPRLSGRMDEDRAGNDSYGLGQSANEFRTNQNPPNRPADRVAQGDGQSRAGGGSRTFAPQQGSDSRQSLDDQGPGDRDNFNAGQDAVTGQTSNPGVRGSQPDDESRGLQMNQRPRSSNGNETPAPRGGIARSEQLVENHPRSANTVETNNSIERSINPDQNAGGLGGGGGGGVGPTGQPQSDGPDTGGLAGGGPGAGEVGSRGPGGGNPGNSGEGEGAGDIGSRELAMSGDSRGRGQPGGGGGFGGGGYGGGGGGDADSSQTNQPQVPNLSPYRSQSPYRIPGGPSNMDISNGSLPNERSSIELSRQQGTFVAILEPESVPRYLFGNSELSESGSDSDSQQAGDKQQYNDALESTGQRLARNIEPQFEARDQSELALDERSLGERSKERLAEESRTDDLDFDTKLNRSFARNGIMEFDSKTKARTVFDDVESGLGLRHVQNWEFMQERQDAERRYEERKEINANALPNQQVYKFWEDPDGDRYERSFGRLGASPSQVEVFYAYDFIEIEADAKAINGLLRDLASNGTDMEMFYAPQSLNLYSVQDGLSQYRRSVSNDDGYMNGDQLADNRRSGYGAVNPSEGQLFSGMQSEFEEAANGESQSGQQSSGEQGSGEQGSGEQGSGEQSSGGQSYGGQGSGQQSSGQEQYDGQQSIGGRPAIGRPGNGRPGSEDESLAGRNRRRSEADSANINGRGLPSAQGQELAQGQSQQPDETDADQAGGGAQSQETIRDDGDQLARGQGGSDSLGVDGRDWAEDRVAADLEAGLAEEQLELKKHLGPADLAYVPLSQWGLRRESEKEELDAYSQLAQPEPSDELLRGEEGVVDPKVGSADDVLGGESGEALANSVRSGNQPPNADSSGGQQDSPVDQAEGLEGDVESLESQRNRFAIGDANQPARGLADGVQPAVQENLNYFVRSSRMFASESVSSFGTEFGLMTESEGANLGFRSSEDRVKDFLAYDGWWSAGVRPLSKSIAQQGLDEMAAAGEANAPVSGSNVEREGDSADGDDGGVAANDSNSSGTNSNDANLSAVVGRDTLERNETAESDTEAKSFRYQPEGDQGRNEVVLTDLVRPEQAMVPQFSRNGRVRLTLVVKRRVAITPATTQPTAPLSVPAESATPELSPAQQDSGDDQ